MKRIDRKTRWLILQEHNHQCVNCGISQEDGFLEIQKDDDGILVSLCNECIEKLKEEKRIKNEQHKQYVNSLKRKNNHRLSIIYSDMLYRCYNEKCPTFKRYGGRGITVCDEWREDFKNFCKWAKENGCDENAPRGECTIDRIDNDGNYEPWNCRWVDMKTQCNNTRRCKKHHNTQQNDL